MFDTKLVEVVTQALALRRITLETGLLRQERQSTRQILRLSIQQQHGVRVKRTVSQVVCDHVLLHELVPLRLDIPVGFRDLQLGKAVKLLATGCRPMHSWAARHQATEYDGKRTSSQRCRTKQSVRTYAIGWQV